MAKTGYKTDAMSRAQRFWSKVNIRGPDECWNWTGAIWSHPHAWGYGKLGRKDDGRRSWLRAHCVAYELTKGPIPLGMCVLHSCDNPLCCNANHLRVGTRVDNAKDMVERDRVYDGRGEANSKGKLTADSVRAIKRGLAAGKSQTELAREFGVIQPHISRIKRGVTWAHVTIDEVVPLDPRRKLTDPEIQQIKRRLKKGHSQETLAIEFKVSASLISRINLGQIHRDVV